MKLVFSLLISIFTITVFVNSPVFAIERAERQSTFTEEQKRQKEARASDNKEKVCSSIDAIAGKVRGEAFKRGNSYSEKKSSNIEDRTKRSAERQKDLISKRAEWDAKREESFNKLRGNAKTDGQKQAVEEYITSLKAAIATRRAAHDVAFAEFHAGLESLLATYRGNYQTASDQSKAKLEQAIATAKADCVAGKDINTIKQNLKTEIKAIRVTIKETKPDDKKSAIKALVEKRKNAVKANNEAFKVSTKQAREKLLAVLTNAQSEL